MTIDAVSEMTNNALYVIIKVSLPVLLVSLIVGLIISIFQTVTSIQEQTLTFVHIRKKEQAKFLKQWA